MARAPEAERRELIDRTAGKPLLLRWMAVQLGRGSCRTLADALGFLAVCPADNDPLEFAFGDLAQAFTEDETRLLCALTYFTEPTEVAHLAEMADVKRPRAEAALRALANRSLVVPDEPERAYALVPLAAEFLRHRRPRAVAERGNRIEKTAYALIAPNGNPHHERYPKLDAAWPTVTPALPLFLAGPHRRLRRVGDLLRLHRPLGRRTCVLDGGGSAPLRRAIRTKRGGTPIGRVGFTNCAVRWASWQSFADSTLFRPP